MQRFRVLVSYRIVWFRFVYCKGSRVAEAEEQYRRTGGMMLHYYSYVTCAHRYNHVVVAVSLARTNRFRALLVAPLPFAFEKAVT